MLAFAAIAEGDLHSSPSEVLSARWASQNEATQALREGSVAQQVVMAIRDAR